MKHVKKAFEKVRHPERGGRSSRREENTSANVINPRENFAANPPQDQSPAKYFSPAEVGAAGHTSNVGYGGAGYGGDQTVRYEEPGGMYPSNERGTIAGPSDHQLYSSEHYQGGQETVTANSANSDRYWENFNPTENSANSANSDAYWANFNPAADNPIRYQEAPHPQNQTFAHTEMTFSPDANAFAAVYSGPPAEGGYVQTHAEGWPNQASSSLDMRPLQEGLQFVQEGLEVVPETRTARELREAQEKTALNEYRSKRDEYKTEFRDDFSRLKSSYYQDIVRMDRHDYSNKKAFQDAVIARHDKLRWDEIAPLERNMETKMGQLNYTIGREAQDSLDYVLDTRQGGKNRIPSRPGFTRRGDIDEDTW